MNVTLDDIFPGNSPPIVHQSEAADCGLACLSMVLSHYGYKTDLSSLRRRFPVSLKGATLSGLIAIADKLGLSCRPLRVDMDEVSSLKLPSILHWNMNHFVVLVKSSSSQLTLHDPARGIVKKHWLKLARNFMRGAAARSNAVLTC
ncbi:MAG: ATP-binding cassette subfamily B protein RaxB [Oceanicoccus sp.]